MFSTVQNPAMLSRRSLPSESTFALVALFGILLLGLPARAGASISFDAASSKASTTSISSLSWSHTLGAGTDRIVIVGVTAENTTATNAAVSSVTFNGVAATAVPNSLISGGGTGIIETQLFYVLNSSLPAPGTYTVQVTFHGSIQGAAVGAVSLFGVNQSAPESVATKVDSSGADSISTSITTHTNGAWVVDAVGSGNSGTFTAASGQTLRWGIASSGSTGASSTKAVATAGATTLSWTHSGANRLAHSLASFAPSAGGTANCTLTTSVSGSGTISQSPSGTTFPCGTSITLTATANSGSTFTGWTGGVTSSANPLTFTLNANTSVTANFATQTANCTLTTAANGPGTVTHTPSGSTFACGTSVTLTATPNAGATFTGWTGGVVSSANPLTFTLSSNTSVTGNFVASGTTPDFHLFGFAAGVTTGGKGGQTVTVSTLADLITQAAITSPLIIQVSGKITGTSGSDIVRVASNKTIVGLGSTAELFAVEVTLQKSSNIIIRNLKISHVLASNHDGDLIHLQDTHNVWIDHCEFFNEPPQTQPNKDLYDGMVDITHDSSNVTISWSFFHDHWKSNLIGSSDSDNFDRRTTFHHNMYQNVASRTPSYRFGTGHVYNTYFTGVMITGVNTRMGAVLRIEGNVFENASDPITSVDSSSVGFWDVRDNTFTNCTGNQPTTSNGTFVPPYTYHLDSSSSVKAIVTQFVGVGKTDPLQNLP